MTENSTKKRTRRISSWMSEAAESIAREEEILAGKKIVLKIIRYMDENKMSQKDLAQKLGVSPQYINKFLHGQDCDIKISTAIRYGKILNINLIEIPDVEPSCKPVNVIVYASHQYKVESTQDFNPNYLSSKSQQVIYN